MLKKINILVNHILNHLKVLDLEMLLLKVEMI